MSSMKSSIILIANPVSKRASEREIQGAIRLLNSAGHEVDLHLTKKRGDAEDFARRYSRTGESFIIAAGGDGTFNEVINGIANTETKMAILPMGTTNVLAKELAIPENVEGAVNRALNGAVHKISLGKISITHPLPVTRYFSLMAGIGFDGAAVFSVNESLKRYSGKGAYVLSGLKTLMKYSPEELIFAADGEAYSGYSAIIGNASKYGGHFKVTPDAALREPLLCVFIMHGKRRSDLLRYFWGIIRGKHLRYRDITYLKASLVEVKGIAHMQIDGDYLGASPAVITVVPNALRLIY